MSRQRSSAATAGGVAVGLNAVIVAVTDEVPRILTVARRRAGEVQLALPFGPLDPAGDRTLELGLRGWVSEQTGIGLGYVEQLYTFGDRNRRQPELGDESRVISVAYLALLRETEPSPDSSGAWQDIYQLLPWEDWRQGRPAVIDKTIAPVIKRWIDIAPRQKRERLERAEIAFGLGAAGWDADRVLDRYELLYELGLVAEAWREQRSAAAGFEHQTRLGTSMRLDHRRMVATALGRLRGKIKYRPVVFELLPDRFTLLQLQRIVEALTGQRLHKQNFRRLVERGGLVEGTGRMETKTGGRPAELFSFRREVLRERPRPGVGLPGTRVG